MKVYEGFVLTINLISPEPNPYLEGVILSAISSPAYIQITMADCTRHEWLGFFIRGTPTNTVADVWLNSWFTLIYPELW